MGTLVSLALIVFFVLLYYLACLKKFTALNERSFKKNPSFSNSFKELYNVLSVLHKIRGLEAVFFKNQYINLINLYIQRIIFELEQIKYFQERHGEIFKNTRISFLHQWIKITTFLFEEDEAEDYVLKEKGSLGRCAELFSLFGDSMESKLSELYMKQALLVLKNEGYSALSAFLGTYGKISSRYGSFGGMIPVSIISSELNQNFLVTYCKEITEQLRREVNIIKKTGSSKEKYVELLNTYIFNFFKTIRPVYFELFKRSQEYYELKGLIENIKFAAK